MAKAINYTGFGEVHGLREWARLLDVNKDTLRYWLTIKGVTVEEFAKKNGIDYKPTLDEGRTRVNRVAQAVALLTQLFERSGYDPIHIHTELIPGVRAQKVYYDGEYVGVYTLDAGTLRFADGVEGINLIEYIIPNPKVYKHAEGWGVHPETRSAVVEALRKPYNPLMSPQ